MFSAVDGVNVMPTNELNKIVFAIKSKEQRAIFERIILDLSIGIVPAMLVSQDGRFETDPTLLVHCAYALLAQFGQHVLSSRYEVTTFADFLAFKCRRRHLRIKMLWPPTLLAAAKNSGYLLTAKGEGDTFNICLY
jgi:hypothetical protein